MLIERQLSVALAAVSAAVTIPACQGMINGRVDHAGIGFGVFVLLGAMGVFMGGAVAAGWDNRILRLLGLTAWTAAGLAFAGGALVAVLHAGGWVGRIGFALAALPPVAGPVWIFVRLIRG